MTVATKVFLNENKIYVSWGLMVLIAISIWAASQKLTQIDLQISQLTPVIKEVSELKTNFALMNRDVADLKKKLDPYEVEFKP